MTLTTTGEEALAANVASPLYVAVRECEPTAKDVTGKLAWPPLREAEPSRTPPSKKDSVPVGTPLPELTVAVRVTVEMSFTLI